MKPTPWKRYVYTIEDDVTGIPLLIQGELITYSDENCPDVIIEDISYGEIPMEQWCFSEKYIEHLKDRIYQQWCKE